MNPIEQAMAKAAAKITREQHNAQLELKIKRQSNAKSIIKEKLENKVLRGKTIAKRQADFQTAENVQNTTGGGILSKIRIRFKKPYAIELNKEVESIEFDVADIKSISYEVVTK